MHDLVTWLTVAAVLVGVIRTFAATLVVASKASLRPEMADFACDGIDDQVEIQQALDALPEAGGTVQLMEGTYLLSGYVEIPRDKVSLRGMGRATILEHAPTSWVPLASNSLQGETTLEVDDASQFRIGQLIGITDEQINPLVEEGSLYWYYSNDLVKTLLHRVTQVSGGTITLDRELEGEARVDRKARVAPAWVMIKAYGKQDLELADFTIDFNRDHVARVYAGYSTFDPPPGYPDQPTPPPPTIFSEVRHGEEVLSAIYLQGAHHSRIHGLYLHDMPNTGLMVFESDHLLVEGNTIRNFGLKGYVNVFGSHCRIIGNEITDSLYEDGICVYDTPSSVAVVANNIVKNCPRACILINQSRKAVVTGNNVRGDDTEDDGGVGIGVTSREGAVTGNYIEHAGTAMTVTTLGAFWGEHSENYPITITGNSICHCCSGIRIRRANHVSIVGNTFSDILGRAAVISLDRTAANGLLVTGNQFMNGRAAGQPAIWLSGQRHLVSGNQFTGFDEGVRLESTAERCTVEGNVFHDVARTVVRREETAPERSLPA